MWEILEYNAGTIVVALILCTVIFGVVVGMIRNKKRGKKTCCSGCVGCPFGDKCPSASEEKTNK